MKKSIKILLIVICVWLFMFLTDFICIKTINKPIFMLNLTTYKDGGTKVYFGLGYKAIKYNVIDGDKSIHIGSYFMKYNPYKKTDGEKFSEEYDSVNSDNVFKYKSVNEIINILNHGTGVVYFGFPECKWCNAYVPMLNDVAKEVGVKNIYYLNIYEDRKNNTDNYQELVTILNSYLGYDEEGNKRIYVPTVVSVKTGEIVGFDDETSYDTHDLKDPKDYWTNDEVNDLKEKLTSMLEKSLYNTCSNCNN